MCRGAAQDKEDKDEYEGDEDNNVDDVDDENIVIVSRVHPHPPQTMDGSSLSVPFWRRAGYYDLIFQLRLAPKT